MFSQAYGSMNIDGITVKHTEGEAIDSRSPHLTIKNVLYSNVTVNTGKLMRFRSPAYIDIDGITIEDVVTQNSDSDYAFDVSGYSTGSISVKNLVARNVSLTNTISFLYSSSTTTTTLHYENFTFEDFTLSNSASVIAYGVFRTANITGMVGNNLVTNQNSVGINSFIRNYYSSTSSSPQISQTISDILLDSSSISLLHMVNFDYDSVVPQSLVLTNATFQNSVIEMSLDIFTLYQMTTLGDYSVEFNDITFKNLSFTLESNLMNLQQQIKSALIIKNVEISDVNNAGITVKSYDTNDVSNNTLVNFENITASNVNGHSRSLISIYEGAEVTIRDSTFNYISNIGQGAVLFAGKRQAIVTFYNSQFHNNTSIDGGVFASESESMIK